MTLVSRIAGASALLAAATMAATPAAAAELPLGTARAAVPMPGAWDSDVVNASDHRWYGYRRHRGVDAGDVIAGVVILGGIAAIASAASRNNRDREYRERYPYPNGDYRDRPYQYRPYRGDPRSMDSQGISRAIDMCVREIERDRRIESVDAVDRLSDGWRVEGAVSGGDGFTCRIGNDGRIDDIDYGQRRWNGSYGESGTGEDRQWDDDAYAQARRNQDAQDAQPAYPGGPVDGDADQDGGADGRYTTAQAPDFGA